MSNGAPPPVPGTAPAKKGMSPWAWVAIGCGGLILVCVIGFTLLTMFVFKKGKEMVTEATGSESFQELVQDLKDNPAKAAAEMAVRVNPDLDVLSTDDEAGTITFLNKKTGEEATLNFEDIAEGRFSMTTSEGEYSLDASDTGEGGVTIKGPEGETRFGTSADLKDVPDWVPVYPGATDVQSAFHSTTGTAVTGAISGKTSDDAQKVIDHFEQLFEGKGYEVTSKSITTTAQGAFAGISAEISEGKTINVAVLGQGTENQVTINYNDKQ